MFYVADVSWAAWANAAGLTVPVVIGYLLWLGAKQDDIAFITALVYAASVVQMLAVPLTRSVSNKKALVVILGFFEILFRFLIIAIPLLVVSAGSSDFRILSSDTHSTNVRVLLLYVIVLLGLVMGYSISPIYSDWIATTLPENLRARVTSQRTLLSTVTSMVCAFAFGKFIDLYPGGPERWNGFAWLMLAGFITGIAGYLALLRAPMPEFATDGSGSILDAMAAILRNRAFVRLLTFAVIWQFAFSLAVPFYGVYMIQNLQLSYSRIAVYSNLAMLVMVLSYRPFGVLVDRFGSKPIMQVLLVPLAIAPCLRAFTSPDHHLLYPVSMALLGLSYAGVSVALSPLLYAMVPKAGNRAAFFAAWSVCASLSGALSTLIGGILAKRLEGVEFLWLGFPMGNLQIIFLLTTLLLLAPLFLVTTIEERKAQTAGWFLSQVWRGNPVSYVYNLFSLNYFAGEANRVRATSGLARSGSPMAVEDLVKALRDLNPEVRRKAAEGLGVLGSEEAVGSLIDQLADRDSDVRAEVAEAMGKTGHPLVLDALVEALEDEDPRVRVSAIRALGEIGGEGIRRLLVDRLQSQGFDRQTRPALIDVLSRMGERRVIPAAVESLTAYHSPVMRAQLLNAICQAFGAGDVFYRLAIQDELRQADRLASAFRKMEKEVLSFHRERAIFAGVALPILRTIRDEFERGHNDAAYQAMVELARHMEELSLAWSGNEEMRAALSQAGAGASALLTLAKALPAEEIGRQEFLFAAVCIGTSLRNLRDCDRLAEGKGPAGRPGFFS
jgi:HEAT repeat protein/MFS family permease